MLSELVRFSRPGREDLSMVDHKPVRAGTPGGEVKVSEWGVSKEF